MKKVLVILLVAMLSVVMVANLSIAGSKEGTVKNIVLCTSVRHLSNPFYQKVLAGAQMLANSRNMRHVTLACEASSEKQINDIRALLARTGGNLVVALWPNEPSDSVAVARILNPAKVYFTTWVVRPKDSRIEDYDYWCAHAVWPNEIGSYTAAIELFKSFETPYEGKIFVLRGQLGGSAENERYAGLKKAIEEHPGVKIVGEEEAVWQRAKGFKATSHMLVAHPDVSGVWAANDDMAMGALEALRAKGLAGKVKVCGFDGNEDMVRAIAKGEAAATVIVDPLYLGGIGLAIPLAAKEGKIDVTSLPPSKREWTPKYTMITQDNAEEFIASYFESTPEYDWDKILNDWLKN